MNSWRCPHTWVRIFSRSFPLAQEQHSRRSFPQTGSQQHRNLRSDQVSGSTAGRGRMQCTHFVNSSSTPATALFTKALVTSPSVSSTCMAPLFTPEMFVFVLYFSHFHLSFVRPIINRPTLSGILIRGWPLIPRLIYKFIPNNLHRSTSLTSVISGACSHTAVRTVRTFCYVRRKKRERERENARLGKGRGQSGEKTVFKPLGRGVWDRENWLVRGEAKTYIISLLRLLRDSIPSKFFLLQRDSSERAANYK